MYRMIMLALMGLVAVLAGCADEPSTTTHSGESTMDFSIAEALGLASIEEEIVQADVIARVSLDSVATEVVSVTEEATGYAPALLFTFDVHEYMKGTGGDEVVGVSPTAEAFDTADEARSHLSRYSSERDSRWDGREAIVFLRDYASLRASQGETPRYFLGYLDLGRDGYTVASPVYKRWLPQASNSEMKTTARSSQAQGEKHFLRDDPARPAAPRSSGGGGQSSGGPSTIALGALKAQVSAIGAQIAAGDGSDAFRKCVYGAYWGSRLIEAGHGWAISHDANMVSGSAGGYKVGGREGYGVGEYTYGEHWMEGDDKDLFRVTTRDLVPRRWYVPETSPPDGTSYLADVVTVRPLPAGVYSVRAHAIRGDLLWCGVITDVQRAYGDEYTVTAEALSGISHEAFFDPAGLTAGVGANATSGVLKPTTFGSNVLDRIEWESGALKVNLTGSHVGKHLDFLDVDGELALTLEVDDAVAADGLLTWAVPDQPWESGDLLMVRLYSKTPELCAPREDFAKPGACY